MKSNKEFSLHYQPIVSLFTGSILGFEALLRWQHPNRGWISPGEFIAIAEDTGAILPLGNWVLKTACRQMYAWQQSFPQFSYLTISVNISCKQFLEPDLVEQIERILEQTGLNPCHLKLEITETGVMENFEEAIVMLNQLRSSGIQLAIDDFGTGYSSLSRLRNLKPNTLKIDRYFIKKMGESGEKLEIVRAIVVLAHSMGMDVTAEGIETPRQVVRCKALQCNSGQGFFFLDL